MKKIKKCPFCGAQAEVSYVNIASLEGSKGTNYLVECVNIDCKAWVQTKAYDTKEEAIAAWNERKADEVKKGE